MNPLTVNSPRKRMKFGEGSLHSLVDKWLHPTDASPARVIGSGRTALARVRFVCLEIERNDRPIALLFFRHVDGTWHIFPQERGRPTMRVACNCPHEVRSGLVQGLDPDECCVYCPPI
jgi:hypothetical protein